MWAFLLTPRGAVKEKTMAVPSVMADLSVTAATNSPAGTESPTAGDDFLRAVQAILRTTNAKGSDIASATTTDIGAATAEFVDVTGTTTITGLGTIGAGIKRIVRFTGVLTLTYNATSLILPGSANITTANGDIARFISLGSGNWVCTGYIKRDGTSLVGVSPAQLQAQTYITFTTGGTSTAYTLTPTPALGSLTTGHRFNVVFNATAGATPTLAISGLTAKSLKYYDKSGAKVAVTSTEIVANLISDVIYDGTDYVVINPARPSFLSYAPVATTSGTSWSFSNVPSWAKRITINFSAFSTNGTSVPIVQIGDSGGLETSGYTGATINSGSVTAFPASGFPLDISHGAAFVLKGSMILTLQDPSTNTWNCVSSIGRSDAAQFYAGGGEKSLTGTLDRFSLTTVLGVDLGDGGSVSALVE